MSKLLSTLAAIAVSIAVTAQAQDIAPPVQRTSASAAGTPAPSDGQKATSTRSAEDYRTALMATAAESGGDPALDGSLVRVLSTLASAGRCGDAAGLAVREGRQELATRVEQLCK